MRIDGLSTYNGMQTYAKPQSASPQNEGTRPPAIVDRYDFSPKALELLRRRDLSEQERQQFGDILSRAEKANAHENPSEFLFSLQPAEMEILRKAHSLAFGINISTLDVEGATNLLYQPGDAKDINNDGFLGVGEGKGFVFPPSNAPDEVKNAWEEATANMSEKDKLLMMGSFMIEATFANVRYDQKHKPIGFYGPDDLEYINPFAQPGYSYADSLKKHIEALVFQEQRGGMSPTEYEFFQKQKDFLYTLQESYRNHGVS